MVVERISPNSSSTSQEARTWVKVGFDELEVTIKDQKNRFGSYENVKLKENKFKSHIFHKMEEADIHGTIKDQDKITKKNIIKDIDTMELSVDIFDKPEHAKNEKLLVDEAFILKQSMDPKDFGVCQSNNNVSQHVESNLDILQQSSTTLESHSRCSFEDNGFEIINASSNHYKNLELDGYLNSSIIHQTPTNLFSAIHKYIPINLEENPLSTLKILKRDGSSLLLDCELQTKTNDFKRSPKRGKSSSGAYEFFLGKKKVNDNESTRPTKELKMSEMKIDGTLDIKKIVNGFKHENKLISKSNNIIQLVQEEKEKIITNSFLSNGVSNEVEKNINIFFESRTIQQSKVDNNKIFDLTKQSLETHIGVGPKDNVKIEFELSRLSKKRKKGPHENDALCQEIPQQISHKIVSFQNYHVQLPTHNKPFIDTTIEQQIKRISTRVQQQNKKHTHVEKTYDVEATLAAAIGFPRESLTEEEVEAHVVHTVGGQEQTNYIIVRNHILAKWRENVNVFLQLDTIMKSVRTQHKGLVAPAYKFLLMHGYINFGVASSIKAVKPIETNKASVIIIGAGLAGLGAARQLLAFGHKVLVLEGRQRPGGRVYTKKMEGEGLMASADLGGSVMTGIEGNPLGVLAQQLNLPLHKIRDKCPLYQPNGLPVKEDVDLKVEAQFNGLLDGASKWREDMEQTADSISLGATLETLRQLGGVGRTSEEQQLYDWHLANLEYANAGLLTKLSLAFWDQDDPYEMGGDHCFLPGGNVKLINALAEDIPIKYGKTVHTIKYGNEGVKVFVGEEIYDADMVLCTIPLGVLQRNMLNFEPELPQRKLDAIKRLGFGLLNKVVMLFPKVFWNSKLDMFGHLAENPNKRGEYFLFYSYAMVSNEPLLLALVAGEAAIEFEKIPPLQAVMRVMTILRGIYEPQNIEVPNPIQTVCTRWGSDFLSYGSYSNVAVEASGDDYDILAENVGNGRLFFAGEATIRRYPATMHGAYLSGLREAGNIAAATAARQIAPKDEDKIQKDLHLYSSTLEELFKEPDLEFGSFSIIFDHQTSDPKSISIVRLKYEEFKNKKTIGNILSKFEKNNHEFYRLKQPFYLYTTITRQQAYELREVRGGNSERLIYLCQKLEVKLVGCKGLGPHGEALVEAIKWYRATKKSMAIMGPPKSFTMLLQSIP